MEERILAIDDEINVAELLARRLGREGYPCETAVSGEGALSKMEEKRFALALIDIRMPGMDGVQLLERTKEIDPDMAAVMVTALRDRESAVRCMKLGASDYIVKPFDWDEVVASVRRALEKRRLVLQVKGYQRDLESKVEEKTEELRRRNRELAALNAISAVVSQSLDLKEILENAVDKVLDIGGIETGSMYLMDQQGEQLVLATYRGVSKEFADEVRTFKMGESLTGQAAQSGEPIVVDDVTGDPRVKITLVSGEGIRSFVAIPMKSRDKVQGVMYVASHEYHQFSPAEIQLYSAIANQIGVAIENARLYKDIQKELAERKRVERLLRALNQAAIAMGRALTPERLFAAVAEELKKLDFSCMVFLTDEGQNRLFPKFLSYESGMIKAAEKLTGLKAEDFSIPIETSDVYRKVIWAKETILVEHTEDSMRQFLPGPAKRFAEQIMRILKVPKTIDAPLIAEDEVIGLLSVQSDDLTEDDIPAITAFAHQLAAAWHKAQLLQELKRSLTERKQAEEELRKHREHLEELIEERTAELRLRRDLAESLVEAAAAISSTLDLEQVLDRILRQVSRVVPNDAANIMLIEGEQAHIVRWHGYERFGAEEFISTAAFRISEMPILQQMTETQESVVVSDTATDPDWIHIPVQEWLRSYAAAPIIVRGEVIGFLNVDSATPGFFTQDHAEALRAFANHAAAIENARLYEAERVARERLRALAGRLETVREEERARIAREIHDEFSQALTALKIDLAWLAKRLPADKPRLAEKASAMSEMIDATIQTMQRVATELRPGLLDDLGLAAAIEWQAQELSERTGFDCELHLADEEIVIDRDLATALFRIFQEILTNIARHADATRVRVDLEDRPDELVLVVHDNGRGIAESQVSDVKSLGLIGMQERARTWGGEVTFQGVPGQGTTVTVRMPRMPRGKKDR